MDDHEEVLIHRTGSIRKMDGLLRDERITKISMESEESGGLLIRFFHDDGPLPFVARVLAHGDQGQAIRDGVLKSINFHLNRED